MCVVEDAGELSSDGEKSLKQTKEEPVLKVVEAIEAGIVRACTFGHSSASQAARPREFDPALHTNITSNFL